MLVAFRGVSGGWERGAPRCPPHLRESVVGKREAVPSAAFPGARGWGDGGSLCSAPLGLPASPAPPSVPLLPAPVSPAPAALGWHPFSARGPGSRWAKRAVGTRSHEGCRLTVRSGADPGRSSRVCAGSQRLRLERQIVLGGRWAPRTSSLSSSLPVLERDKLFIRTTHSWKCELASSSYTPTGSLLARGL